MKATRATQNPGGKLPPIIQRRLHSLVARVLRISWLEGALWLVAVGCALVLVQATADWLFDLSRSTRALILLGDFAIFGWLVFQYGIKPWRKRLTPELAALRAEKHWPALRTSLISAVQLARQPDGSPFLVDTLISQVAKRVEQLDFRVIVGTAHLRRLLVAAVALLLVTGALAWWGGPKSAILWQRLWLKNVPLPTQTIVVPVSGDFAIQPGQTIELAAKVQGVVPRSGRVEVTYVGQPVQTIGIIAKPGSPELFTLTLPNVQQPLTYRFYLNDGRSPEFKVAIVHGPVLEAVTFEQLYPAYTGLAKTQHAAGNLTLLSGSKLHIEGRASQPLKAAHLLLSGLDQTAEMRVGADRKTVSAELAIPAEKLEGLAVVLQNTNGTESQENTIYRVEIIPDKPPEIIFATDQPEMASFITTAHPRLRFEVRDDFQVKQVFLCCGSDGEKPDSPMLSKLKRIPLEVPKPAGALNYDYLWEKTGESGLWKEGATINYWIEAMDNNDVTGPGIGRTPVHQWQVISIEAKRQELAEKLRKHGEAIDELSKRQEELRSNVGDLIKQD